MDGEDRKVPGERLTRRLHDRVARRPRLGFTPEFYARHGFDDPWAAPGDGEPAPSTDGGMVYLSGAPYRAMMRRLAAARKRRERRTAAFAERRSGTKLRAVARRWPGEPGASVVSLARLAAPEVVLPSPAVARAETPTEIEVEGAPVQRRDKAGARVISGASAWGTAGPSPRSAAPPSAVAPPAATSPPAAPRGAEVAGPRPLERVGQRMAPAREAYVDVLAAAVAPSRRRKVARAVAEVELLPEVERKPALARRMRALGAAAPVLREVEPSLAAAPKRTRALVTGTRTTAMSSRSPALALASSSETDRAAASTLAAAAHQPRPTAPWQPRPSAFGVPAWAVGLDPRAARAPAVRSSAPVPAAPVPAAPPSAPLQAPPQAPRVSAAAPAPAAPSVASTGSSPGAAGWVGTAAPPTGPTRGPTGRPTRTASAPAQPPDDPIDTPTIWRAPLSARAMARSFGDEVSVGPRALQPRAVASLRAAWTLSGDDLAVPSPRPDALPPDPISGEVSASPRAASPRPTPWGTATGTSTSATRDASGPPPGAAARGAEARVAPAKDGRTASVRASSVAVAAARAARATPARLSSSPVSRVEALWAPTDATVRRSPSPRSALVSPPAEATAAPSRPPSFRRPAGLPDTAGLAVAAREPYLGAPPSSAGASFGDPFPTVALPGGDVRGGRPAAWPPSTPPMPSTGASARPGPDAATTPARTVAVATPDSRPDVPAAPPTLRASARADRSWGLPSPVAGPVEAAFAELRRALESTPGAVALPATTYAHAFARLATAAPGPVRFVEAVIRDAVLATPRGTSARAESPESSVPNLADALVDAPLGRLAGRGSPLATTTPPPRVSGPLAWAGAQRPPISAPPNESSRPDQLRRRGAKVDVTPRATRRTLGSDAMTPTTRGIAQPPASAEAPSAGSLVPGAERTGEAPRTRALSWANARADVQRATAYQGALGDPAPADSPRARGSLAPTRSTRRPASPELTPIAAEGPAPELGRRLHGLAAGTAPDAASPTWSARADGAPRVRSVGGLFDALARARDAEEVVRVLFLRADGLREAPAEVQAPIQAVIREIRQEVASPEARAVTPATEAVRPPRTAAPEARTLQQAPVRSASQRASSAGATRPSTVAWRGATTIHSGDDRVMKLVRKLQDLIHLAESQHRLADAQRQVRMAEDTAQARAEAGHGAGKPGAAVGGNEQVDIDALVREVSAAISNELELRRSRRMEDPDESNWW